MGAGLVDGGWRRAALEWSGAAARGARTLTLRAAALCVSLATTASLFAQDATPPRPSSTTVTQDAAERALAERVQAFVAGAGHSDNLLRLAYDLAFASLPPRPPTALIAARRARIEQLLAMFPAAEEEQRRIASYYAATLAFGAGDVAAAIDFAEQAAEANDPGIRHHALEFLMSTLLEHERISEAWVYLPRLDAVFGADRAALMRSELYLRIGMVRLAALELAKVGVAGRGIEYRRLRLEELLVTEQFEKALASATSFAAEVAAGDPDPDRNRYRERAELAWTFAAARTGREAEAERRLEALVRAPSPMERARVDLAMLRLRRGDAPADVRPLLAAEFGRDYAELSIFPLLARARVELALAGQDALPAGAVVALRDALAARLGASLQQWRSTPERSPGVAFLQLSVRRDLLAALCQVEQLVGGDDRVDRCFAHALATDACGSLARSLDLDVPTAHDLLAVVAPRRGALIWYIPAPNGSVALLAVGESRHAVVLPCDLPLRGQVRELRRLVTDELRAGDDYRASIGRVAAPIAAWAFPAALRDLLVGCDRWTVIGRELLTNLPFEFLPWPHADSWLGHSVALDYVPSVTLAVAQARAASGSGEPLLARVQVLAATELDAAVASEFRVAPVPGDDLARLLADLPSGAGRLVPAVDRELLLDACAHATTAIVIAHGRERRDAVFAADDTSLARYRPLGIVLRDGFFGVEQLETSPRAPWLVVLAACGTARAGVARGEDGLLFGTSWLAAGSRAVLSAEGDLELTATSRLIRYFVGELQRGSEPAEALRRARVRVAADPGFEHPSCSCLLRLDRTLEPAAEAK